MSVVGRPPLLAVGHQRGQIILQRLIVERPERRGIVEILAHRVGRDAALVQYLDRQRVGPPVLVRPPKQRVEPVLTDRTTLCGVHGGLGVHAASPLYPIGLLVENGARRRAAARRKGCGRTRSEEHTSELQSLMRISYAVFCLNKKTT